MPVYEYECQSCRQHFEMIQKFSDPPLSRCESCGGPLKKVLSPPALMFKGSGWYVTDYSGKKQQKDKTDSGEAPSSAEKPKESAATPSTSKSSEATPAPKKENK